MPKPEIKIVCQLCIADESFDSHGTLQLFRTLPCELCALQMTTGYIGTAKSPAVLGGNTP